MNPLNRSGTRWLSLRSLQSRLIRKQVAWPLSLRKDHVTDCDIAGLAALPSFTEEFYTWLAQARTQVVMQKVPCSSSVLLGWHGLEVCWKCRFLDLIPHLLRTSLVGHQFLPIHRCQMFCPVTYLWELQSRVRKEIDANRTGKYQQRSA